MTFVMGDQLSEAWPWDSTDQMVECSLLRPSIVLVVVDSSLTDRACIVAHQKMSLGACYQSFLWLSNFEGNYP